MWKNRKKNLEGGSGRECDWDNQVGITKKLRNGIEGDKQVEETYVKEGGIEEEEEEDGQGETEKIFKNVRKREDIGEEGNRGEEKEDEKKGKKYTLKGGVEIYEGG